MIWSAITAIFGNRKPRRVRLKMTQQEAFGERLESRVVMSANTLNTTALQSIRSFDSEPNNTRGTADLVRSFGAGTHSTTVDGSTGSGSMVQRSPGDDHGNDRFSATKLSMRLSFSGTANGEIERRGDRDYFKVDLNHLLFTPNVTFSVDQRSGSTLDPMMRLLDSSGREIAMNDDFGGSRNSQITRTVARAVYYIEVTGHRSSPAGTYSVSVRPNTPTGVTDDHGNNRQSATEIRLGLSNTGSMNGMIERARDIDYFKFYVGGLSSTQTMRIDVSQRAGSTLDPMTKLFNAAGQEIASNDDVGNSLNSQIIKTLARGWYYIEVTGHSANPTGLYTVSVRPTSIVPSIDDHENTVFARATAISLTGSTVNSVSGSRSGVIERVGDLDLFRFDNLGTKRFTIDVTSLSGSRLDTYVDIYDERGRWVAGNDDGGTGTNSLLTLTLGSGRYFVRVSGVSSSTGEYTVTVQGVTGASDDSGRERLNLNRNHYVQDNDQTTNRRKEYVVNATRSGTFEITVVPRGFGATLRNPRIEIRDTNNRLIASSQPGRLNEAMLRVNLTQGIDYRISVIGTSGDGSFRLEMAA